MALSPVNNLEELVSERVRVRVLVRRKASPAQLPPLAVAVAVTPGADPLLLPPLGLLQSL